MKIAVFTEYYPSSENPGSGVYVHTRAAAYRAAGHEVRVYRVRPGPATWAEHAGVSVLAAEAEPLRDEYQRFAPDVLAVHTPHPSAPHTQLAAALTTPRVAWIHGYEAMLTALCGYHQGLDRALSLLHDARKLWRLRRWLSGAAAVVYVSEWMRRTAERNLSLRHPRSAVIPNPVDVDRFRPADHPRADPVSRALVLRPLNWVHGVDVSVTAFAGLSGTELRIVGLGPDAPDLRALATRLEAPVIIEERAVPHAEMPALLKAHDFLISPERKIPTQGVAMCEAMACGLPVIAVRAGGIPEYLRDGVDGFLVRPGKPADLRRAVLELISQPERAREMSRNAREYVTMRCSASLIISKELELLATVGT
ncbi:MAG: hypothetical protein AMS25_13060 [Gemmatimonas sp. SM23_52]|nr:MAG: hypothetical protein AMS25_13060 [Gemmatimonas sp. SM23_52]